MRKRCENFKMREINAIYRKKLSQFVEATGILSVKIKNGNNVGGIVPK